MIPVILSGGSGTRLWPLSSGERPKQLLSLTGERSLLQETALRLSGVAPLVICSRSQANETIEQLTEVDCAPRLLITEPVGRNTAPALYAAACAIEGDPILAAFPADHHLSRPEELLTALQLAEVEARRGHIVVFGVAPRWPETGYGYIEVGEPSGSGFLVARFAEKPDAETASAYLAGGMHLWNSGMFVMRSSILRSEIRLHAPEIARCVDAALATATTQDGRLELGDAFEKAPALSIDVAVMERTETGLVLPLEAGWSDVGSWSAVWDLSPKDENGNVATGEVVLAAVRNSYLRSTDRLLAVVGMEDVVVVDTPEGVLVVARHRAQEVKELFKGT